MEITQELVEHMAQLSRLELTQAEKPVIAAQMERVLDYMAVLDKLDTRGVAPMRHGGQVKNVLREDETAPSLKREALLAGAPAADGEAFLVPSSVEQEGTAWN